MSFRGAFDAGAKAVPPKLPESLDFAIWEVRIFLPEDLFGGGEDFNEVVEGSRRHFEYQMLYIRGQKLELSSPIRQVSTVLSGILSHGLITRSTTSRYNWTWSCT